MLSRPPSPVSELLIPCGDLSSPWNQRNPKRSDGVVEFWCFQQSNTPLLHRSGSLIFHRGQDVWVWRFTRFRIANHNMIMEKEFMQSEPASKKMLWAGRTLSALPVLLLLFSASIKLM